MLKILNHCCSGHFLKAASEKDVYGMNEKMTIAIRQVLNHTYFKKTRQGE